MGAITLRTSHPYAGEWAGTDFLASAATLTTDPEALIFSPILLRTAGLLALSNVFMTFAWYAHLRNLSDRPWYIAAMVSWGIALFEYLLQVPANRIGYSALSLSQLKILQEVIALIGVRSFCGAVHAAADQAGLPLGCAVPGGSGVLRLSLAGNLLITRFIPAVVMAGWLAGLPLSGQVQPERARDMGIPLDGTPGPLDAITDVAGVAVGHVTRSSAERGSFEVGIGPVRTGVTAVFPRGTAELAQVFAGWFSLNGNGEMTGTAWLDDYGLLLYPSPSPIRTASARFAMPSSNGDGPGFPGSSIAACRRWPRPGMATSTTSMAFMSRKSTCSPRWRRQSQVPWRRETLAGEPECSASASREASAPRAGGISAQDGGFTVGVLVQCNFGLRRQLRIAGSPGGAGDHRAEALLRHEGPLDTADRRSIRCPAGARPSGSTARSSSSSRPTHRCFPISSGG